MNNLDLGIIGNCRSAALINKHGGIEWACLPQFDSPSVFAKILDKSKGGSFEIRTSPDYEITQKYIPNTAILVTEFSNGQDIFECIDFMPRYIDQNGQYFCPPEMARYIKFIKGKPIFTVNYDPKLLYAKASTKTKIKEEYIKSKAVDGPYDSVYLYTSFDHNAVLESEPLSLTEDHGFFVVSYNEKLLQQSVERVYLQMQRTRVYWLNWCENTTRFKSYRKEIMRSALTLKLLSFDKSGAVLAAATTSLPETIGEVRNWDYRFCWIRDASMVIKVVHALGHNRMAENFLKFIVQIVPNKEEKMQIMYGIDGQKELEEIFLDHLDGYMGSKPVRIGNAAYIQRQNDIYGILMDVVLQLFQKFNIGLFNSEELWTITKTTVNNVKENWQKPDKGIWEFRTEERHFTFSKLLCWVAMDRGVKIAKLLNKTSLMDKWASERDKIKKEIEEKSWSEKKQAYTQSYGSEDLDASTLLMENYGFCEARDSRFISTVKATENELSNDGLLYRYKNEDDFGLPSSSFTICTFWFIQSLYKIGEKKRAQEWFNKLLGYSNHLGLFSEDIDFKTKRLLGNFPQAYSHLALIETALLFNEEEEGILLEKLE